MAANGSYTGKTFNSRYIVGELIGVGGMAEVYLADDTVLGRKVAVKVLLPQYAKDPDFSRHFRNEAAAAANLQSPYIVSIYDWGSAEDTYFIVMEYLRGSDLKTAIQQRGPISERKAAEIGVQVCQALAVAHGQGIIHRDIKPQNIMVQTDGNVKVMDFGIARALNSNADKTQAVLGTAHYVSPEQAQGLDLTPATDIYSLGCVLYEALTGELPFDGPDAVSVALMQVQNTPAMPRAINPEISPDMERIVVTAMQKDPHARFESANDMRAALMDFLSGKPADATVPLVMTGNGFAGEKTQVLPGVAAGAPATTIPVIDQTQVMPVSMPTVREYAGGGVSTQAQYMGYEEAPRRGHGVRNFFIAFFCIVAVAVAALGILYATGTFGFGTQEVPILTGTSVDEARGAIVDAGFRVGQITQEYSDTVAEGDVISQDPDGGQAAPGSSINLVVSQGAEQIEVPNVVNTEQAAAIQTITSSSFAVGSVTTEKSSDVDTGKVIRQSPEAGTQAARNSAIDLVISEGPEDAEVPAITGLSLSAARRRVEDAGLRLEETHEYSNTVAEDMVISQSPEAGSTLELNGTVTCVVSDGTGQVTVPNVYGYNQADAVAALEALGLVVYGSGDTENGTVISQNPTAGSIVQAGSSVTLTFSSSTPRRSNIINN